MVSNNGMNITVIGCGVAGLATAYYLSEAYGQHAITLVDARDPMSFTSAQSGDNYRNWWPHQTMTRFCDHSIDLMEELAADHPRALNMNSNGYLLASRESDLDRLCATHLNVDSERWRIHRQKASYVNAQDGDGVDVLVGSSAIRDVYPTFNPEIRHLIHIRRAGHFDSQGMAQHMLEVVRHRGGRRLTGKVMSIDLGPPFTLQVEGKNGPLVIRADKIVNAAGPFAGHVAEMMGVSLPLFNVYQQKLAFDDVWGHVPRDLPFSIDLDPMNMSWTDEEREYLNSEPNLAFLADEMPGGRHCRPDGRGQSVKLGWAYNRRVSEPIWQLANDPCNLDLFPELVIRGAAALQPALGAYVANPPSRWVHYGGYYTMTEENWPLIGPMGIDDAFVVAGLSGFGSMAACAAGDVCAAWVTDSNRPDFASQLSLSRYEDKALMTQLKEAQQKGIV